MTLAARVRRAASAAPTWLPDAALVAAVLVPVAAAMVWAVRDGWYPVGDNAYFSLRPRDVLTGDHPWLGTWTSASQSTGINANNPGPLLFDVLALPAKVDPVLGPMVGTGLLAAASAVAAVLTGRSVAGRSGAVVVAAAAAALMWSMGSALVVDPWQPHSLLLPFLLFVVLVWAVLAGRQRALVAAVAVGSLLVQTHLPYVVLVPGFLVLGVGAVLLRVRSEQPSERRVVLRTIAVATLVGAVLWVQPVVEQLTGDGEGNLTRLARSTSAGDDPSAGPVDATRILTSVIAPWPGWERGDFADTLQPRLDRLVSPAELPPLAGLPEGRGAALRLAGLAVVLGGAGLLARRRDDGVWGSGVVVAAAGVAGALVTIAILPLSRYGVAVHQVRWLWPLGIIVTALVVAALIGERRAALLRGVATVAVVVLVVASVGRHRHPLGPTADDDAAPALQVLAGQLGDARVDGPVVLDEDELRVFEPYSIAVVLELDRRGIEVVVDDPGLVRQLGDGRRATGRETERLLVLQGPDPALPAGARVLAAVDGLDNRSERARAALEVDVRVMASAGRLELTELGAAVLAAGNLPWLRASPDEPLDPALVDTPGTLAEAVHRGYVLAGTGDLEALRRWARLERARDRNTVTVAVAPIE